MNRSDAYDLPRRTNLGEVFRMGPSFANVQRLTSASRLQRASSASQLQVQQTAGEVVLEPLPPPRAVSSHTEEKCRLEADENRKLLEERLRLMEKSRPSSAPSGDTPSSPSRQRTKVSRFARETRCRVPRRDLHQNYSGLWGELNPFDPVQNPNAHRLLIQRSLSPPRGSRSPSRDKDLESFRPSFRTEWLIALRHELLKGTREENKKLRHDFDLAIAAAVSEVRAGYEAAVEAIRKDYADAAADIRHDFVDAFIEGDISHMIEAANVKRRQVDVDFTPLFSEMEKLKSSVLEVVQNNQTTFQSTLSTTLSAETTKSVSDLSRSISNDFVRVLDQVEAARSSAIEEIRSHQVDLSPVLTAIEAVDRDVVDLGPVLDSVKEMEIKVETNVQKVLAAVEDAPHGSILHQIDEAKARMEQDSFIILNAIAGIGIDIGEQLECLKDLGEASLASMSKLDLDSVVSKVESSVIKNAQQIEETVKKSAKPPDFSAVLAAIAKIDLGAVSRHMDSRYQDTCKFMDSSVLRPVLKAVHEHEADLSPILERVGKVIDQQDDIATKQDTKVDILYKAVIDTKDCAIETQKLAARPDFTPVLKAIPPPTDLSPVLQAIGKVDVRPQVHVNLQEVLDAVGKISPDMRGALTTTTTELSERAQTDTNRLSAAIVQICADINSHSCVLSEAVADLKRCNQVAHENVMNTLSQDAEKATDAFQESDARREAGVRQVLDAIAGVEEADLLPMLQEMKVIENSANAIRIATLDTHTAILDAIKGIHVDPVDFKPILQEMTALSNSIHRMDSEAKAELKAVLEKVKVVDSNTSIDVLAPLLKAIHGIDVKPVVDLQPILEAVNSIELNPIVQVDTRPVLDILKGALAKIEFAWAKVDNKEVMEAIQRIDKRMLEAIVKIDAKDPTRSPNFIWASEASKWT